MNKKYDIIYAPIITEKTAMMEAENKYAFKVDPKANKTEIKQAIESIFKVKVVSMKCLLRLQGAGMLKEISRIMPAGLKGLPKWRRY